MKSKFKNLKFESIQVLSKEEQSKIKGAYSYTPGSGGSAGGMVKPQTCLFYCTSTVTGRSWSYYAGQNDGGSRCSWYEMAGYGPCR